MHEDLKFLLSGQPVLTGGAWGTLLQARGLDFGGCPDACNIAYPNVISEIANEYARAGSVIVLTNTFQANRVALMRHNLAEHIGEINRTGVAMARRGVNNCAFIVASVGPIGSKPGERSEAELEDIYFEQASALEEGQPYGFVVETMVSAAELRAALSAVHNFGRLVVASIAIGIGKTPDRLLSGEPLEEAIRIAEEGGADVVGLNCMEASVIQSYLPRLRAATTLPLWLKPNLGYPHLYEGKAVYHMTPDEFTESVMPLISGGAAFIGGCCGTTPAHLQTLALRYHSGWVDALGKFAY